MSRKNERTDLIDIIKVMEVEGKPLRGMCICITGHLAKSRAEIVKLIEEGGGKFHRRVKYDTTHLLTNADWTKGTVESTSSKFRKAKQYGCKILSEEQFLALFACNGNLNKNL